MYRSSNSNFCYILLVMTWRLNICVILFVPLQVLLCPCLCPVKSSKHSNTRVGTSKRVSQPCRPEDCNPKTSLLSCVDIESERNSLPKRPEDCSLKTRLLSGFEIESKSEIDIDISKMLAEVQVTKSPNDAREYR